MPQLDIYTYFTQFQWLLVIFTLIFILVNGNYVPTFQSLFVIRNFIGSLLGSNTSDLKGVNGSGTNQSKTLLGFDYEKGKSTLTKKDSHGTLAIVGQWDQIYEKYNASKINAKKVSNKVNESQKPKLGKKKITSKKK
jgi:hypothetical protein